MSDPLECLTVAEVADKLRLSEDAVYGLLARGDLRGVRIGNGRGLWRVTRQALGEFLCGPTRPHRTVVQLRGGGK